METTMSKKQVQNTLFVALAACVLYVAHAQFTAPDASDRVALAQWVQR